MSKYVSLVIVSVLLLASSWPVGAASPSEWPSLNFDAAHSNTNGFEKTLNAHNVLKLRVKWTAPESDLSYPVVAGGRVYVPEPVRGKTEVRVLDAATGKRLGTLTEDASGGMLMYGGNLYLAGHRLRVVDPSTGDELAQILPAHAPRGSFFVNPVADRNVILVGYASPRAPGRLYTIDPVSNRLVRTMPSASALGAIATGRILTETASGSAFYDERSGKALSVHPFLRSNWFAGDTLLYTVASVKGSNTTLYAYDGSGHKTWSRVVGMPLAVQEWPHAVTSDAVFVQFLKPQAGVEALDPLTGSILWSRHLRDVQQIVEANGLLYVLTYGLGQPVRLIVLRAASGAGIGAITLSSGYYAFPAVNGLLVANGMVFLRVVSATGSQVLVAFGQ